jgi:hypothetical protein
MIEMLLHDMAEILPEDGAQQQTIIMFIYVM